MMINTIIISIILTGLTAYPLVELVRPDKELSHNK